MNSLIDIARSGVLAYRSALATTTENVANANTEGYIRREVVLTPLAGATMTPTSSATQGQGVAVTDVRRAFDSLTADRLRASESAVSAAQVRVSSGQGIEQAFLPGAEGIKQALSGFFDSLNTLASAPADIGLRKVVMTSGQEIASRFASTAQNLQNVRDDALASIRLGLSEVSERLRDLFTINTQMEGVRSTPGAVNPLHDQRDALLTEIASKIDVNVTLNTIGQAEVRLGPGPGGLVLLNRQSAARLDLGSTAPVSIQVSNGSVTQASTAFSQGEVGGYVASLAATDSALQELDGLARSFAEDLNTVHAGSIDLDGNSGSELFTLSGTTIKPAATNAGAAAVQVAGGALAAAVNLTYDAAQGIWSARDGSGSVLASGGSPLIIGGTRITLEGPAKDGDRFTLTPRTGHAVDMAFVLRDPRMLAAARAVISSAAAENTGTSTANLSKIALPDLPVPDLRGLISANPAEAISLLQSGVVGVIPAGTSSVDLYSLARQASADFIVSDADLLAGGALRFSTAEGAFEFSFGPGLDAAALSDALNAGTITAAGGETIEDLGIRAGGVAGQLSLAQRNGDFLSADLLVPAGSFAGMLAASDPAASQLQVFTRDGRQIAGTPLSAAEANAYMTAANGFSAGAVYNTDYLNGVGGIGYRGTMVSRQIVPGKESLVLAADSAAASHLQLQSGSGTTDLAFSIGTSAARLAATINGTLPGLTATAKTSLTLSNASDGTLRFDLAGKNVTPIRVTAEVAAGDLSSLARAVNNAQAQTGVTAELSADGQRLRLVQTSGEDIRITGFGQSEGGTLTATATDMAGIARAQSVVLAGDGASANLVQSGQVELSSAEDFSVLTDGVLHGSSADPFGGGMVSRVDSAAGETVQLKFVVEDADGAATSADGVTTVAAGVAHRLTVNGVQVEQAGGATSAEVAINLRSALRAAAPSYEMVGEALASLPPEGTTLRVGLDGADYFVRMASGQPVVIGPETGRLSAAFDANGRLKLAVTGGSPDGVGLDPDVSSPAAAQFGLTSGATLRATGAPIGPAVLSPTGASVEVNLAGTGYAVLVEDQGGLLTATLPAGFPGSVSFDADNRMVFEWAANLGPLQIASAPDVGMASAGVVTTVVNGELRLESVTGQPPAISVDVTATAAERLHLSNLPPEDLIVIMTGPGALRLAGTFGAVAPVVGERATELRVTDQQTGAVELVDSATGHSIANGWLNADGQVSLGGVLASFTGRPATGDRFVITANSNPAGDARGLDRMLTLADADPSQGSGGFAKILAELTSDIGAQTRAAVKKEEAVATVHDTLSRKLADFGAVDLDAEAAKLIELQQAYQASAQALSVERQLFDTLLNSL